MRATAVRRTRQSVMLAGGVAAVLLAVPAAADPGEGKSGKPDHKTSGGDAGDNRHPSGRDRSTESGKSGGQGGSQSDPDGMSNGGADKPGGSGGVDQGDQDWNNGCGNDDDFEDDNNGNCGGLGKRGAGEGGAGAVRAEVRGATVDLDLRGSAIERGWAWARAWAKAHAAANAGIPAGELGSARSVATAGRSAAVVGAFNGKGADLATGTSVAASAASAQRAATSTAVAGAGASSGVEVLGVRIDRELPFTGLPLAAAAGLGAASVATGAASVAVARRRTAR